MFDPLIFELMTLKSDQFIGYVRYTCPVPMILGSQAIFAYIMSPMAFELWTRDPNI